VTRALLRCGLVAGPVFLGVAAVEGGRRPHYRALRHPVSSLALGGRSGTQVTNFLVSGALCGAFAVGLARARVAGARLDPWLIALSGSGLVACGVFPADPVNGYPPGTPPQPEHMTPAGVAHLVASSAIMIGVPATTAIQAWVAHRTGDRRWMKVSVAATGLTATSFAGACAGFAQVSVLPEVAGLLQRVAVASAFAWLAGLAARTLRRVRR
jgi:hypothetical protein